METILVPLDFSDHSFNALRRAVEFSKSVNAEVQLIYVKPTKMLKSLFGSASSQDSIQQELEDKVEELNKEYNTTFKFHQMEGAIYSNIVQTAEDINADLIVMGTHGHSGFEEFWVGGNAYKTVSAAPCPVITMRETFVKNAIENIILPIDQSAHTRQKVPLTADIAKQFGAVVHSVGICTDNDDETVFRMRQYQNQVIEYLEEHNVTVKDELVFGKNITEITLDYAKQNNGDLISIMTEQEISPSNLIMGAFAQQMVNHSSIPVLSTRPNPRYEGDVRY